MAWREWRLVRSLDRLDYAALELAPGEYVEWSAAASRAQGTHLVGGKIYVTEIERAERALGQLGLEPPAAAPTGDADDPTP